MFEENGIAGSSVYCVGYVDCLAAIVLPIIAYVESASCVGRPCFPDCGGQMGFDLVSKRSKGVHVVIVLTP